MFIIPLEGHFGCSVLSASECVKGFWQKRCAIGARVASERGGKTHKNEQTRARLRKNSGTLGDRENKKMKTCELAGYVENVKGNQNFLCQEGV